METVDSTSFQPGIHVVYLKGMANAKKHKAKTKNGTFSNNMFCPIVMGILLMFCQSLKLEFSGSLLPWMLQQSQIHL